MANDNNDKKKPQQASLVTRGLLLLATPVVVSEASLRLAAELQGGMAGPVFRRLLPVVRRYYLPPRSWLLEHPVLAGSALAAGAVGAALLYRTWLLVWNNQVQARLAGTHFTPETVGFPEHRFELLQQVAARPLPTAPRGKKPGTGRSTFLGLQAKKGLFGWRWRPFYLSDSQRSMHVHVLGKTGSGKTTSVIFPQVLQDCVDGRGVVLMDAKGSDENIRTMKGIAAVANRKAELKVFALPAWNRPEIFSHRYNMVYVRPRHGSEPGGDVSAMAARVFSVLQLGDNEYYNTQAELMFTQLCRLLHGIDREDCDAGEPFVMRDISICLKGIGATDEYNEALEHCLKRSTDKDAAREIRNQISRLGADVQKCFSGLIGAIDRFLSHLVNAYNPDIIFEVVLEKGQLVYVQLPGNLFKVQAPAVGKVMLMDIQQEGSLRQVYRAVRSQKPFSVFVDEFYNFADLSMVDSLNKLRDANIRYMLAHQSIADLELVDDKFAQAVLDNTRTRIILNQDNPELCEKVAKSVGTTQVVEKTVRQERGPLLTSLNTGDASTKLVETFRLHPNAIKGLASAGQAYCHSNGKIIPLALAELPRVEAEYQLSRNDQESCPGLRLERFLDKKKG